MDIVGRMGPRTRGRKSLGWLTAVVIAAPCSGTASAADLPATPGSLPSVFASAQTGDTIVLGAGSYGVFRGGMKSGNVTLKPQSGAAVTMALDFAPASNITIEGVTLTEIEIGDARTKSITVRGADIPGQTTFRTGELQNSNILFDSNVHRDFNKCAGCGEGRIHLPENTNQPSGITIQNSKFLRGNSDGIQNGSNGTRIINNEFANIRQVDGADGVHADALQLYGSKNTLIQGNWFHDVGSAIMAPDGAEREIIEDNVIQSTNPFAIQLGSDNGSIVRHNTLPDGACEFNKRCGIITLGSKPGLPGGRETIITDNILGEIAFTGGSATTAEENFNLLAVVGGRGLKDVRGKPTYLGGTAPTSYAGFALASGSRGKGDASDGSDRGARIGAVAPAAGIPATPVAVGPPVIKVLTKLRSIGKTRKLRLLVKVSGAGTIRLESSIRPGRASDRARSRHSRAVITLRPRVLTFDIAGGRTIVFKLKRSAARALARSKNASLSVHSYAGDSRTQRLRTSRLTIRR